jgi:hypothetical protein
LNKTGGAYTVKTFDDKEEFGVCCCVLFWSHVLKFLLKAMDIMNFSKDEQDSVFRIVAGKETS